MEQILSQSIQNSNEGELIFLKTNELSASCENFIKLQWSYKDLPKRYAEFGTVYRYEQSGELHGLTRVRGFTKMMHIYSVHQTNLLKEFERCN